jgi:hypothetical protein
MKILEDIMVAVVEEDTVEGVAVLVWVSTGQGQGGDRPRRGHQNTPGRGHGGRGGCGGRNLAAANRATSILNLTQIKKNTRATGTWYNLENENVRLILYFYWNQCALLSDEFLEQLDHRLEPLLIDELQGHLEDPVLVASKADVIRNLSKGQRPTVIPHSAFVTCTSSGGPIPVVYHLRTARATNKETLASDSPAMSTATL